MCLWRMCQGPREPLKMRQRHLVIKGRSGEPDTRCDRNQITEQALPLVNLCHALPASPPLRYCVQRKVLSLTTSVGASLIDRGGAGSSPCQLDPMISMISSTAILARLY